MNNSNPILTASKLKNWKKKNKVYNFKSLPKTVIITPHSNLIKGFKKIFIKKIKGLNGKNYLLNKDILLSQNFGIGAPALCNQIEELIALGVKQFVFIGFAGIIDNNTNQNTAYLINSAYSLNGVTSFYIDNNFIDYKNSWSSILQSELKLQKCIAVSTDAIFKETPELIKEFRDKNTSLIDMESASFLAITKFYKVASTCILISSDKIENNQWFPPKNMQTLTQLVDRIINRIKDIK